MEAKKAMIGDIFAPSSSRSLCIPFFQRPYVWDDEKWDRFHSAMLHISENKTPYFMGSVILKKNGEDGDVNALYSVIDGQQRLTTLCIYAKVLCVLDNNLSGFEQVFCKFQVPEALILQHSKINAPSFERVMEVDTSEKMQELKESAATVDHDKILGAFSHFMGELKSPDSRPILKAILSHAQFISIELDESENEQQIFETINSIGMPLSAAELIKNYLYSGAEQEANYNKNWRPVFEEGDNSKFWNQSVGGPGERPIIDLFFYAYLQIKAQQARGKSGKSISDVTQDGVFVAFQKLCDCKNGVFTKEEMQKDIRKYAEVFRVAFSPELAERLPSDPCMARLNVIIFGMKTTTIVPYVLFVLLAEKSEQKQNEVFGAIESYIMRRIVTKASSKNYSRLFSEQLIGRGVKASASAAAFWKVVNGKSDDNLDRLPSDQEVHDAVLSTRLYNKQACGVLYFIEIGMHTSHHSTAMRKMSEYSVDHIMPRKWQTHWKDDIPEGSDKAIQRGKTLLTLGNLAVVTRPLNSRMKNAAWADKKKHLTEHAYTPSMHEALRSRKWDEEAIAERAKLLAEKVLEIWPAG